MQLDALAPLHDDHVDPPERQLRGEDAKQLARAAYDDATDADDDASDSDADGGTDGDRAVIGRPPENVYDLLPGPDSAA